jgi:hypothetical protein
MNISDIQSAIRSDRTKITKHANEEAGNDRLPFEEVFDSVFFGEILEDYLLDRPFPSCLIYGKNKKEEPIHSVWALKPDGESILITVYRPDENLWIDSRQRKSK